MRRGTRERFWCSHCAEELVRLPLHQLQSFLRRHPQAAMLAACDQAAAALGVHAIVTVCGNCGCLMPFTRGPRTHTH